jgi:hypothetical protein
MSKEIPLDSGGVTIVDDEDYDALKTQDWTQHTSGHVVVFERIEGRRRIVCNPPE